MNTSTWVSYHYAILRVVPHVHLGSFVNVGVVLHARTTEFLGMQAVDDPESLRALAGDVDVALLERYLRAYRGICDGDAAAGPLALVSESERFHWLTSPRSDVLQASPVHEGLCPDPAEALADLFGRFVRPDPG